jgi:hypothetical protein
MDLQSLDKFIKTLDACAAQDESRTAICAIHELAVLGDQTRLCATDGHILAVVDIFTDLVTYACKQLWLFKLETEGQVSYVTYKKRHLTAEAVHPYPAILNAIPKLKPMTEHSRKCFGIKNIKRYCDLLNAYHERSSMQFDCFLPNYSAASLISADVYVTKGLFILLMPKCTCYTDGELPEVSPINDYLPGFLPEPELPEDALSEQWVGEDTDPDTKPTDAQQDTEATDAKN